jgi:hypothetical protein
MLEFFIGGNYARDFVVFHYGYMSTIVWTNMMPVKHEMLIDLGATIQECSPTSEASHREEKISPKRFHRGT